jgi:hypothetical protein
MAENESLDVSNRRFCWVTADILRGRPPEEIAHHILKNMCAAWSYVRKNGFDVVTVIGLATAGQDVSDVIRSTGGSDFAHLIKLHGNPMQLTGGVLDSVNLAAIEQVIDSGLQQAASHPDGPDVLEVANIKRQLIMSCKPAISSVTDALLGGRSRVRAPAVWSEFRSVSPVSLGMPADLLGQSLLPSAQRTAQGVAS